MNTTDSGLRELVAEWRRTADVLTKAGIYSQCHAARLRVCADELESLLTAAGEAQAEPPVFYIRHDGTHGEFPVVAPAGMVLVPRPMETAPKDGRLLRLLVAFSNHAIDDSIAPVWTVGSNTFDNHGDEDEWKFAGWSWEQDCFTQGEGTPVGWLPWDAAVPAAQVEAPIPMILLCPICGKQHIDAPETRDIPSGDGFAEVADWTNPPHRSHLCHACGCIWRPADVLTVGVERIESRGKADTWDVADAPAVVIDEGAAVDLSKVLSAFDKAASIAQRHAGNVDAIEERGGEEADDPMEAIHFILHSAYHAWKRTYGRQPVSALTAALKQGEG